MNSTILDPPDAKLMDLLARLYRMKIFSITKERGRPVLNFHMHRAQITDPALVAVLNHAASSEAAIIELYTTMNFWLKGPRIVRLSQREAESMERTKSAFSLADYVQPFPTMLLQLPKDYALKKIVDCPQAGELLGGRELPADHYPHAIVVHHEKSEIVNTILAAVHFTSGQVVTLHVTSGDIEGTIDEIMNQIQHQQLTSDAKASQDEITISHAVTRAAINTFYLLGTEGMIELGPDVNIVERTKKLQRLQKQGRERIVAAIRREILGVRWYYGFRKGFVFYNTSREGGTVRPHWRSGHMRNQRYGPGYSLSKLIRIAPVLVNGHLLTD